uniref:Uncharacterized protein n=1 Tax=Anguilla anguilla TaxID=7936 RepID=A0A0E9VFB3_ANGAN
MSFESKMCHSVAAKARCLLLLPALYLIAV